MYDASALLCATLLGSLAATPAAAQQPAPVSRQLDEPGSASVTIIGHVLEPRPLEPTAERLRGLTLPDGFAIDVFADGLVNPRVLAVADDGSVYVTRRSVGDVLLLRDEDGDGRADVQRSVASRPQLHGIAIDGDTVWLATVTDLYRTRRQPDGGFGALERIVDDLPEGGQHANRMVVVGPDGALYVSVGSTCNACDETNPENATILRVAPDGSTRSIYASGLRNTIGYGFAPGTGVLFGMDHGIDWLGDDAQQEELNRLEQGRRYGWPYVYARGKFNPQDEPPGGIAMAEWAAQSSEPVALYTPHAAPMQLAFYTGEQFPAEYRGDAFVAMRGSWNREPPSGYELVRIRFQDGEPAGFEPFLTGFLTKTDDGQWGCLGRPVGVAQATDGALLLADDTNGRIYRISYTGPRPSQPAVGAGPPGPAVPAAAATTDPTARSATMAASGPDEGSRDRPLALAALDVPDAPRLDVTSPAFAAGEAIPDTYAAEQEDVSPPLAWSAGPPGTRSYAVLVEDPDGERAPPYVHWLVYHVPADVMSLREALPSAPQLVQPSLRQGQNDRGATGWTGMRPPQGDAAHDYHFQVFALDTALDVPHGASRQALLDAMRGHVLAAGELVGTYERP